MMRKLSWLILIILVFLTGGCIKETYDMNMLSKMMHLNPTLAIRAIKGNISLSDLVKSDDTIVFDQNNFVKIIFKKDSVLELKLADFYNFNNMVSFSQTYTIGDISIAPFQSTTAITLDQISLHFSTVQRNQFLALNDGSAHQFPPFPSTDLGEISFSSFTNFENAVFKSGFLDISIKNNLTTPLDNISVILYNTSGHTSIGSVVIPGIQPGQTQATSIDLTGKTITNSIIAAIVLSGSQGNPDLVLIDMNSNIQITVQGRDLRVNSGRVILQPQSITSLDNYDTIIFNPGTNIELDEFKITTGNLTYHIQSNSQVSGSFAIKLSTVKRGGIPLTETININPNSTLSEIFPVDNTISDLGTDPVRPFNRLPFEYAVTLSSKGQMISFNKDDQILLDLNLINPDFDYLKGYFGQETHTGDVDTLELGIKDILNHINGDLLLSSPTIKFKYSNSFAVPVELTLIGRSQKQAQTVFLGLAPFNITYPNAPVQRDISGSFTIDKTNSSLPELVSLPLEQIWFTGSAKMNPQGNTGDRNNYIFGNSRIIGSLEVELPLEFRAGNLQFTDTVDNFLKVEGSDKENPIKPENFEFFRIDLTAKNGFPLGVSVKMSLFDSFSNSIKSTATADKILEPAQVDSNGKATTPAETYTSFEYTKDFFNSIDNADKIILQFILNTTGNGTKDVKIYSDYRIDFNAALVLKPDIILK